MGREFFIDWWFFGLLLFIDMMFWVCVKLLLLGYWELLEFGVLLLRVCLGLLVCWGGIFVCDGLFEVLILLIEIVFVICVLLGVRDVLEDESFLILVDVIFCGGGIFIIY